MKSLLLLGMLLGIVAASNLNDFSALLSYESFAKDFAKEAIVTFAENLAEEGSNDFCQDFATFLAKSAVEKYSAIENKDETDNDASPLSLYSFFEGVMARYKDQDHSKLAPVTQECKAALEVFVQTQKTDTNTKAAMDALKSFLVALEEKGDPCAGAINVFTDEMVAKQTFEIPNLTVLTSAVKNIVPKIKELKGLPNSAKLPCVLATGKLFTKYRVKITSLIDLIGTLGVVPESMIEAFKKMTDSFKVKDEF